MITRKRVPVIYRHDCLAYDHVFWTYKPHGKKIMSSLTLHGIIDKLAVSIYIIRDTTRPDHGKDYTSYRFVKTA